jgi:hypothetical protein
LNENNIRTRVVNGRKEIFDTIRHTYVTCTPEEVVRQIYIHYLIHDLHVPPITISVEKKIIYHQLVRRYDIVVVSKEQCLLIVECKAPSIALSENIVYQIAAYNNVMQAKYIVLFNGKQEFICKKTNNQYLFCESLPVYDQM